MDNSEGESSVHTVFIFISHIRTVTVKQHSTAVPLTFSSSYSFTVGAVFLCSIVLPSVMILLLRAGIQTLRVKCVNC